MLSIPTVDRDPLSVALKRKAQTGCAGASTGRMIAAGEGWRVVDVVCTSGPGDRVFAERFAAVSISLVLSGTFVYRSAQGSSLMAPGGLLLGKTGLAYEVSHEHGEGDRCLSFQFAADLFEQIAYDAGAARGGFDRDRMPPLRTLAPLTARAIMALDRADSFADSFEEIALALASAVMQLAGNAPRDTRGVPARDHDRIARALRQLESNSAAAHSLAALARTAGLSRYHFLRTFTRVTGVTPHQWLLRARLRTAAQRLITSRAPITEIALDVGFADLSNFIRSFRAEFGMPPGRYRRVTMFRAGRKLSFTVTSS